MLTNNFNTENNQAHEYVNHNKNKKPNSNKFQTNMHNSLH